MVIYSEFTHWKWVDLSIVMLVYQRVPDNLHTQDILIDVENEPF